MDHATDLLIIGDVHGCYYTLKKLVKKNWHPDTTLLVQVGDLVNKGPHSARCIAYWLKLEKKYPGRTYMIRGNHEQFLIQAIKRPFLMNPCSSVRTDLKNSELNLKKVRKWLETLPLKWENDNLLITHAGIARNIKDPWHVSSRSGVLFNKGPLASLDKIQIKGHSIVEGNKPVFNPKENAWYIDTGAWTKKYLTALRLNMQGEKLAVVRVPTDQRDRD